MSKRVFAIFVELIPLAAILLYFILFKIGAQTGNADTLISEASFVLAFLGFVFAFIGKKLDGKNIVVRILGKLDKLITVLIIVFFVGIVLICGL
ncbi:MAG: hypothetical protein J5802_02095 [Butyrivibrio sp.]|nr:hypothetical protein [Butyrivibrio sp.]